MSLYVDSSALLKRYVDEPDSAECDQFLGSDPVLLTARHTVVEVRRNLARIVEEKDLPALREEFMNDLESFSIVELDAVTCDSAAGIAETLGVRTLDALHLAAAQRVGGSTISFLTYDIRQAQAARSLGLVVLGS